MNWDVEGLYDNANTKFLGILYFICIGLYFFACTFHGNVKFGLRFFSFTFYPLVPQETFMNSFIMNAILMNIYMHSLIYILVNLFRQFTRGSEAAIFFQVIAKN
mmetsp:Transcript_15652/g.23993  ORF Transcript_15652/g.23993 Transcript_15652/m.23993 type:complete len:104 (-) Transcript_15652:155-466(-)